MVEAVGGELRVVGFGLLRDVPQQRQTFRVVKFVVLHPGHSHSSRGGVWECEEREKSARRTLCAKSF